MDAVSFVLILVFFVWFPVEFVTGDLVPGLHRGGNRMNPQDRGSQLIEYVLAFPVLIIAFLMAIYNVTTLPGWTFYPGLVLMAIGIFIRQWAILTLGSYFSRASGVHEGQKVVDTGPYRFIRHPAYTGVLIAFLGIGMAISSWGTTLLLLVVFAVAYGYRVSVEEKVLASEFGDEYVRYMKRTKRLIPFIL